MRSTDPARRMTEEAGADRCRVLRELHQSGCFVIPNPSRLCAGGPRALAALALALCIALPARTRAQGAPPAVTLPATELHTMHSAATRSDYLIYVALPAGYVPGDTTLYPVLYLLDGDSQFAIAAQAYRLQTIGHEVRDAILVGIGYPTSGTETFARRSHDMTPTQVAAEDSILGARYGRPVTTGGAPAFLAALKDEIIPFVEHHYRASSERIFRCERCSPLDRWKPTAWCHPSGG